MVPGTLLVPGRPTYLGYSRARAFYACRRCGWGVLDTFLIYHFPLLSPFLWETARYRLKYCLKGPLSPNQPTNIPSRSTFYSDKNMDMTRECISDAFDPRDRLLSPQISLSMKEPVGFSFYLRQLIQGI